MRIFLYEYLCARHDVGRASGPSYDEETLRVEGRAMRDAVAEDLRDAGAELTLFGPEDYVEDERIAFRRKAATANLTLVIAPEFGGILETRCRWTTGAGSQLLGPSPDAVRLTSDKYTMSRYFATSGVPTPRTWLDPASERRELFPQIWKPRDGAGSLATRRIDSAENFTAAPAGELIGQEWVSGRPASVSFLIGPAGVVPLPPVWQLMSPGDPIEYHGGQTPIPEPFAGRAVRLAARAIRCVPNLAGYVGVDLILGRTAGEDRVLEINPRLTTSYVGLRRLAEGNLGEAMLTLFKGGPLPELRWRPGTVWFRTDGRIEFGERDEPVRV